MGTAAENKNKNVPVPASAVNDPEMEIDLIELFFTLLANWKIILLAMIVGMAATGAVHHFLIKPSYSASTELYITSSDSVISIQDLQVGTALAADYTRIIKSRRVLKDVIDTLELDTSVESLQNMITVTNPASTHIISTSVVTGDPELSRNIANAVLNTSIDAIYQVVGTSEPTIIDYAEAEAVKEVTPSLYLFLAIGALAGIVLACGFVTLRMLTDNTMKTDDDVERYLQLPVLAAVPFYKE